MLLRNKGKTVIKGQNYETTKDSLTKDTPHRVTMQKQPQQPYTQDMRQTLKTAKTHRKNRNTSKDENYRILKEQLSESFCLPFTFQRFKSMKIKTASNPTMTSSLSLPLNVTTLLLSSSKTSSTITPTSSSQMVDIAKTLKTRKISQVSMKPHWCCGLSSLPILLLLLLLVHSQNVINALGSTGQSTSTATIKYSQPFGAEETNENSFRPVIPKDINLEYISENVFTKAGQYRVFEPIESDLRATATLTKKSNEEQSHQTNGGEIENAQARQTKAAAVEASAKFQSNAGTASGVHSAATATVTAKSKQIPYENAISTRPQPPLTWPLKPNAATTPTGEAEASLASEMKGLEGLLAEYVDNFFNKGQYQPKPELIMALQHNYTDMKQQFEQNIQPHLPGQVLPMKKTRPVRQAITKRKSGELSVNIPRAFESGRLLFFAGLKKVMWPIYMGLQILKSLMFALLLPTLIGSFGKLLGKGITSGSAPLFIRPMDEPQDLDFKDNNFNFDDDNNKFNLMDDASNGAGAGVKGNGYAYNQAEASQTHNQYAYNAASINQQALSRFSLNERQQLMQDSYLSALQSLGAASFKNSNGILGSSSSGGLAAPMRQKPAAAANVNTFQQFQKVPASSLLLSNYDPFYSPLLSRLDSVFAQLKLNSDNEDCREKLICLMYANPAKYAPYSNLVSAQLSRELNELRKPTSDNPDILRFFKYMRAAKDGQDGIDCEKSFEKCKEFKDFENPAMVSTYHDINKLVQARKLT